MSSKFQSFKDLHTAAGLFVLPNAWDAKSARIFQEKGFAAIGTSSAAVAGSLGYGDGEEMPFADHLFVVRRIMAAVQVPVSVDIEMGYGSSNEEIYQNIRQLTDLGIAGINIEDSVITEHTRRLKDAKQFANTISYLKNKLTAEGIDLFINIRCDTFILNVDNKLQETFRRLKVYEDTGADGIFLPCISAENDITAVVNSTSFPLNVMAMPDLPDIDTLRRLGVARLSLGPLAFNKAYENVGNILSY
ncbi:isocitrate lyase/phosphoenolpyruvate mutase family protein [Flavitalea sp. BT771]|uniref:isocitrate lyase/PEP mutase family protein n=1 Tax=Flavitalea sp. BT771 TaxID=3063329 RepID=UPI0026E38607|nr:isocitrate lyase/phosphoenolpyruvate mutase family protein [Flavitalea sp. BT771]MDO6429103.1 isocitrate lyase/phosphoenolpyruvate mutase family protein [Flavitalea sp. BT771]MDV6218769.1 isocitrate lyase/phosphoenolpyruvate mutase family protein [Flavitalea sp. BT771]